MTGEAENILSSLSPVVYTIRSSRHTAIKHSGTTCARIVCGVNGGDFEWPKFYIYKDCVCNESTVDEHNILAL